MGMVAFNFPNQDRQGLLMDMFGFNIPAQDRQGIN